MALPQRPGSLARPGIADLATQGADGHAHQQPARPGTVPDRVRRQLVHREGDVYCPVVRYARAGRAAEG